MKLNVNLPQTPYDIVIEKGVLVKAGDWVKSLWQPQKSPLLQITKLEVCMPKSKAQYRKCWL